MEVQKAIIVGLIVIGISILLSICPLNRYVKSCSNDNANKRFNVYKSLIGPGSLMSIGFVFLIIGLLCQSGVLKLFQTALQAGIFFNILAILIAIYPIKLFSQALKKRDEVGMYRACLFLFIPSVLLVISILFVTAHLTYI